MDKLWWRAAWGLCLVQLSLAQLQIDLNITCRYAGVFHVEKNGRYSISRTEAPDLCKAFNSTLPTMAQMQQALAKGFETCRYGFIQGHVVIPRIHPNAICAANNTGVYILTSNTSHYDTYCFNASAPLDEDCTSVTDLPNSFDGIVTITIVNRDGTRYSKKGEYRTHEEDINPSQPMDEDMSSGSSSERSTSGGYTIFHTHLPTSQPSTDQEDAGVSENNPTTTWETSSSTTEETATQREQWFGNGWHGGYHQTPREESHSTAGTTEASAHDGHPDQRMTTQSQEDHFWTDHFDPISHPMGRGHQTERTMDVDSSHSTTLQPPVDPNTDSVEDVNGTGPISVTTRDQDAGGRSHTTHGSGSAGHSSGSQEGGATTTSGPIRKPHIPEWLIILASLLALALILAVCIAVNSRRRCGQKKKLVINNGNGTVDDRKPSGLNGEASKSQEMVHLVNKESSETPDQFMTADETRNLQNVDMKIGV
ncbi:CD44 antigen isoform X7 [Marmota flaviventris]|uniref:CD44 antigen isoform X7 n=1 Tax=Marmota flaviventris TaxID=93162 RepID=UPI000FFFC2BF|nr:CD44 antigen isoform X7 [Marmota flaviventris]